MRITELERKLLRNIAENEYAPLNGGAPEKYDDTGAVWSNSLECGPESIKKQQVAGVVSSLLRKGLVHQEGAGRDATVSLTREGFQAYRDDPFQRASGT